jgi:hypothetical protein
MMSRVILLLSMLAACTPLLAGDLELLFSKDSGELTYIRDGSFINFDNAEVSMGAFLNENNDIAPYAGLMSEVLKDKINVFKEPLSFAIGGRIYYPLLTAPSDDVIGLAFGVSAGYTIRIFKKMPIHLETTAYYAPEVLTSGDQTSILDWHIIRGEIELTERTTGIVGLRRFEVNGAEGGDQDLDNGLNLGLRYQF